MKTFLFATDGSAYSEHAAQLTAEYLEAWPEAKLIVLYVTAKENYAYDLVPESVDNYEEQLTKQIKEDVKNRLFSNWKDRVQFIHQTGHPSITICNVAKEKHANLIIVGSHGRGLVDRALLGSVAHGVLHRTHIPVLVVRK
ncbi:universal stress protein [Virgibacillus dakarensis]|uniref:Universal stress protein n=1 Tax=Lentibacillus populi TaxID=1827502 RepID=A0A9W5TXN5_9BACI|nr:MULTISPECIES: universal stress protein [Bacillaceae]MBT2214890.1 universal stress protein [Virgibacillus dakarensis]MTW84513.1 universal stress protein [Virgibacillus dakarensis]GGB42209.1 universal stress protein [Lentibacillus populi]